jgi:hypothetical protein
VTSFSAVVEARASGGVAIKLPFDATEEWGERERYDVTGTVGAHRVRGKLVPRGSDYYLELGPAWCRDNALGPGSNVAVALTLEGPQLTNVGADFAAALQAEPETHRFFDSLPGGHARIVTRLPLS